MRTGAGALLAPASHPCQQSFADDCLWLLAFICWDFGIYVIHRTLQLLFKLHEEQDEDHPHSNSYWKLRRQGVSQERTSGKRKCQQEHSHSREYPEDQFAFPVHFSFTSLSASDASCAY